MANFLLQLVPEGLFSRICQAAIGYLLKYDNIRLRYWGLVLLSGPCTLACFCFASVACILLSSNGRAHIGQRSSVRKLPLAKGPLTLDKIVLTAWCNACSILHLQSGLSIQFLRGQRQKKLGLT